MGSLWTTGGKIIVDASGKLSYCDTCPCVCSGCCDGTDIPLTLYGTYVIDGVTLFSAEPFIYSIPNDRWESLGFTGGRWCDPTDGQYFWLLGIFNCVDGVDGKVPILQLVVEYGGAPFIYFAPQDSPTGTRSISYCADQFSPGLVVSKSLSCVPFALQITCNNLYSVVNEGSGVTIPAGPTCGLNDAPVNTIQWTFTLTE